jgi:signal transduction histidine kinase/FixJ family two-component response regulator
MKLTTKIFRIFTFIFLAQLIAVGIWAYFMYSTKGDQLPESVVSSLTKVDNAILEGIVLQNKIGSKLARDLVAYKLLELNNVDSAIFLEASSLNEYRLKMELRNCINYQDVTVCSTSNNVAVSLIPLRFGKTIVGHLKLEKSLKIVKELNQKVLYTVGLTILVVFLINCFSLVVIWWRFLKPETARLIRAIENKKRDPGIIVEEYKKIQDIFLDVISNVKEAEAQLQKASFATQVAHDIRSPLEVLKSLKDEMDPLPEASKRRLLLSILRIEEIAYNLLKSRKEIAENELHSNSENLSSIILSTVMEKQIEYRFSPHIRINEVLGSDALDAFSMINKSALKSILSNLINNAVESLKSTNGKVEIYLESDATKNLIVVRDSGPGIPTELWNKLFMNGFTTKEEGNGLGLFSAKREIESEGGSIHFETELDKGTSFIITLPKSTKSAIAISTINTYSYQSIIILDDDPSFHEVWTTRLSEIKSKIVHIYSVKEMLSKYQSLDSNVLLLSDFELMDDKCDGIDIILQFNHAKHSVLVTARSDETAILDRCEHSGIKLLPKSLVNYVKVLNDLQVTTDVVFSVILIDDDRLIHLNWKMFCKKNQIGFKGFMSIAEFLAASLTLDKSSTIFIDSNLSDGVKGEIESEKIFKLGFFNLYLATGYEKNSIQKPHWIKDVLSKSPEHLKGK